MLQMAKMVGFIPTKNYEVARAFYEGKLGFTFVSQDSSALVFRIGVDMLRVILTPHGAATSGTVLGWQVDDIEATVDWLAERGVATEKYSFAQDHVRGILTTPGGKVAWFKDPDGNVLAINQHAGEDVCFLPG